MTAQQPIVYWRPGCEFCARLFRDLERAEIAYSSVNIWDDEKGATIVRSYARGNETVPTVVIGDVGLVNPSVETIRLALQA